MLMRFAPADCERFLSLERPARARSRATSSRSSCRRRRTCNATGFAGLASCSASRSVPRPARPRDPGSRRLRDRQPRRVPRPLARLAAPQVAGPREQPLRQARRALRPGHAVRPAVPPARRRRGVEAGLRRPRDGRHGRDHRGDGRGLPRRRRRDPDRAPRSPQVRVAAAAPTGVVLADGTRDRGRARRFERGSEAHVT